MFNCQRVSCTIRVPNKKSISPSSEQSGFRLFHLTVDHRGGSAWPVPTVPNRTNRDPATAGPRAAHCSSFSARQRWIHSSRSRANCKALQPWMAKTLWYIATERWKITMFHGKTHHKWVGKNTVFQQSSERKPHWIRIFLVSFAGRHIHSEWGLSINLSVSDC